MIACEFIREAYNRGSVVWFVAHREELIEQINKGLEAFGIPHGLIIPGQAPEGQRVYAGIVNSFYSRIKSSNLSAEAPNLIIIDEAHRSLGGMFKKIIFSHPNAAVLGLTATPVRGDSANLGLIYKGMLQFITISEAIEQGWLVPVRYFTPAIVDVRKFKTDRSGDYSRNAVIDWANRPENKKRLVGDVVENWFHNFSNRKTVFFYDSVERSQEAAEEFKRYGIAAAHLDGNTPKQVRREVIAEMRLGKLQILTNAELFVEGLDIPEISCIGLCKITKTPAAYLQRVGRGMRPLESYIRGLSTAEERRAAIASSPKKDLVVVDHVGTAYRMGLVEEYNEWFLNPQDANINSRSTERKKTEELKRCPQCTALTTRWPCPECGYEPPKPERNLIYTPGNLVEWNYAEAVGKRRKFSEEQARLFYLELRTLEERWRPDEKANARARHAFKSRFGRFPPWSWDSLEPVFASPATERWWEGRRKHRAIAFFKAREKRGIKTL